MNVDALNVLAASAALVTAAGLLQALLGSWSVRRHAARAPQDVPGWRPSVTVLKPLHGDEPLLEEALASFCEQAYPGMQIVFGMQDSADPAMHVIRRLRARFPDVDIAVVIDATQHGVNRKIGNLINMYRFAKHDVLVLADSDIHAPPGYLANLVQTLAQPDVGLVTTLYAGLGATDTIAARLGMAQINHSFLPGALLARGLGRQDCLGATMALRRDTLEQIGGLEALAGHLADDAVLGQLVAALGLSVALAGTVGMTTVPEITIGSLFAHELRWARTIQSVAPVGFVLSSLQYPMFWAAMAMVASGGAKWALMLFVVTWLVRAIAALMVDSALGLAPAAPVWLLPARDFLSVAVILASYGGTEVAWRGHILHISPTPSLAQGKG